ncbi:MAG: hypothetical protein LBL69_05895 [Zoogloeaceae bacterium]|jgi:flagellar assembly protein FliH|nr:hypothetical protein [Zoogloeaceae bacterium]
MSRAQARGFIPQEKISKNALRRWHAEDFAPGCTPHHPRLIEPETLPDEHAEARKKAQAAGLLEGRKAGYEAGLASGRKAAYAENYAAAKAAGQAEGEKAGHAEGFAQGEAEGRKSGHEAGFAAGFAEGQKTALAEAEQLGQVAQGFAEALKTLDQQMAEAVLSLALEVAAQVSCAAVKVEPERLLPVIRKALAALPQTTGAEAPTVFIAPETLQAVGEMLTQQLIPQGAKLEADPALAAGDVRIASGPSGIDASLATRWQQVVAAIGAKPEDWLIRAQTSSAGEAE